MKDFAAAVSRYLNAMVEDERIVKYSLKVTGKTCLAKITYPSFNEFVLFTGQ